MTEGESPESVTTISGEVHRTHNLNSKHTHPQCPAPIASKSPHPQAYHNPNECPKSGQKQMVKGDRLVKLDNLVPS
eukprot:CAMPEP_0173396708 /NCGR_PEP_ID=MMETSP1356-20130122/36316_1 /TAXON_ID=77927 ORGANISM="Hemiselmis virescens, Strain PCC157" /NCGR_SAMPLE_ID=MMETSP1356 /ASSEMBLY_ACC=CAM_ASM_000847 /LENGTH=75 /DNA_ID=CAMNT_0014355797 /DNA_START=58 /DNA_END=282 /DNA_ORIENTATION=-